MVNEFAELVNAWPINNIWLLLTPVANPPWQYRKGPVGKQIHHS